jgi:hypothetical protein
MRLILFVTLVGGFALLADQRAEYQSVKQKFSRIERANVPRGASVQLSAAEINAYVRSEFPHVAPAGVQSPNVQLLGNNVATGTVQVDFLKLLSGRQKPTSWFLQKLLAGDHQVAVTALVRSQGGQATVDLQRVEVAGVPLSGAAINFLIDNCVRPTYPGVKIGRAFALPKNVDRLKVDSGAVNVFVR